MLRARVAIATGLTRASSRNMDERCRVEETALFALAKCVQRIYDVRVSNYKSSRSNHDNHDNVLVAR